MVRQPGQALIPPGSAQKKVKCNNIF